MESRQAHILDAAIRVLGTRGARHLTHRAVDAEAGLPLGSTSNYFRTRQALVSGVLNRLRAVETAAWAEIAAGLGDPRELDVDRFAEAVGELLRRLAGPLRVASLARLAVFVEAAFHPELGELVAAGRRELATWGVEWVRRLGSPEPERHFWALLALIDGLLSHQYAVPDPAFDPTPAIRALLHGICGPR